MTQYWEQVDGLNVRQDSNIYIAGTLQAGWTRGASQKQFPSGDVLLHSNGMTGNKGNIWSLELLKR